MSFDKENFFQEYKTNAKSARKEIDESLKAAIKLVNHAVKVSEKYKIPFTTDIVIGFKDDTYVPKSLEKLIQDFSQLEDFPLIDGKDYTDKPIIEDSSSDDDDDDDDDDDWYDDGGDPHIGPPYEPKNDGFVNFFDAFVCSMGQDFKRLHVDPEENSLAYGWSSEGWSSSSLDC